MSRKTFVVFEDDLDGSKGEDVAPLRFSFEGDDYLIDLRKSNQDLFRALLEPFIDAAMRVPVSRTVGRSYLPRARVTAIRALDRQEAKEERARIREVLLANGVKVKPRGSISEKHMVEYRRIVAGQSGGVTSAGS